jgi:selenocysteine lyase/cysteine desulfurase
VSLPGARDRFPVLARHAYLNAGSSGPLSSATLAAMAQTRSWEAEHGRAGRAYYDDMLARRERVRVLFAGETGVPSEHLALTVSTTQSVHVVVTGLDLTPEHEVVTTDVEHFGLMGPLAASGAQLRIAEVRGSRPEDVSELVLAQVTPRTRLIAISAVSWIDGTILPWRELREATGVPVLVDGAQSVGAVEVDATEADFYTVSGPEALRPRLVSYASQQAYDVAAGTWEPKAGAARFDTMLTPANALAGLEAAFEDLPAGRLAHGCALAERCRQLLEARGHDVVTWPGQATLVSFRTTGDPAEAAVALYAKGVIVRDLPGTDLLRASVGWWNDDSDLERLVDGLAAL